MTSNNNSNNSYFNAATGIVALFLMISFSSCKKTNTDFGNPAVLQLFNAMEEGTHVRTNLTGNHPINYSSTLFLYSRYYDNTSTNYITHAKQPIAIYGEKDTLEKDAPLLSLELSLDRGACYSLFFYGSKAQPDYKLHKDIYPAGNPRDSLTFIRFVNFYSNRAVAVNVNGKPPGNIVSNLDYAAIGAFIPMPVNISIPEYIFEFTDKLTGSVIATYTLDLATSLAIFNQIPVFNKPITLILTGKYNSVNEPQPSVEFMPNY